MRIARHCNKLHLNVYPKNQLRTEKWGGHYALLVAMLHLLHSITMENNAKKLIIIIAKTHVNEYSAISNQVIS